METVTHEETWESYWARLLRIDFFEGQWEMYRNVANARAEWLESTFNLDRNAPVLSCACGEGGIELALARRGFKVTGIDRSTTFIHFAREQASQEGLEGATFITTDLSKDWELGRFGTVCCFDTFGLLSNETEQTLVTRMARALTHGGRLLVDAPQRESQRSARTWSPLKGGFLLTETRWDKATGMQLIEPLFIEPDGTRVVLNDPYDKAREDQTGIARYLYTPDELTRLVQTSGLPTQAVRHQRGGYYMVVAGLGLDD